MINLSDFRINIPNRAAYVRGTPLLRPLQGILNNRSRFTNTIVNKSPNNYYYLSPSNPDAALYLTKAFGAPGVMFQGDWRSTSSIVLTYWQWGPSVWAIEELV